MYDRIYYKNAPLKEYYPDYEKVVFTSAFNKRQMVDHLFNKDWELQYCMIKINGLPIPMMNTG